MRDIKLDPTRLVRLFKMGWKFMDRRTTRRTLKTKMLTTLHNRNYHQQRCQCKSLNFIRNTSDFPTTIKENQFEDHKDLKGLNSSTSPSATTTTTLTQKPGNNYTINIYYNDPKKMLTKQQNLDNLENFQKQPMMDKEKLLRDLNGSMEESQYDETLRQVLLLNLLKDHRSVLERNFKKFLEEDLKDMNPTKIGLLKQYLEEKSSQQIQQQQQEPNTNHILNVLRGTTEQNKMAFVREALELCDKIIDESNLAEEEKESEDSLKTNDWNYNEDEDTPRPVVHGEINEKNMLNKKEETYPFKSLEVESEDIEVPPQRSSTLNDIIMNHQDTAFKKVVEVDKEEIDKFEDTKFKSIENLKDTEDSMTIGTVAQSCSSSSSASSSSSSSSAMNTSLPPASSSAPTKATSCKWKKK